MFVFQCHVKEEATVLLTKVFRNGNSQTVRIPAEIADTNADIALEIERVDDELRIRPVRHSKKIRSVQPRLYGRRPRRSGTSPSGSAVMPHFMLDTNRCIYLMKHQPESVARHFSQCSVGEVVISSITLAELEYGMTACTHPSRERHHWSAPLGPGQFGADQWIRLAHGYS